jgi:hypothetical protein
LFVSSAFQINRIFDHEHFLANAPMAAAMVDIPARCDARAMMQRPPVNPQTITPREFLDSAVLIPAYRAAYREVV